MFSGLPVMKLSTPTTSCPCASRRSERCDERNPAPPEIRIRIDLLILRFFCFIVLSKSAPIKFRLTSSRQSMLITMCHWRLVRQRRRPIVAPHPPQDRPDRFKTENQSDCTFHLRANRIVPADEGP